MLQYGKYFSMPEYVSSISIMVTFQVAPDVYWIVPLEG